MFSSWPSAYWDCCSEPSRTRTWVAALRPRPGSNSATAHVPATYHRVMETALVEFAIAATLLILAPGPDSMLVLRNSLRGGRRVGLSTAAGTVTGLLTWALAAALGITTLVTASRVGYDVLRLFGGAYLVWLGVMTLRRRQSKPAHAPAAPDMRLVALAPPVCAGPTSTGSSRMPATPRLACSLLRSCPM